MKRYALYTRHRCLHIGVLLVALCIVPSALAQKSGMTKADYHDYLVRSGQVAGKQFQGGPLVTQAAAGPSDVKLSVLDIGNVRARIRNTGTLGYDRDLLCYEFPFNSGITYRWTMGPMIAGTIDGVKRVSGAAYGAVRTSSEDEYRPLKGYDSGQTNTAQNIGIAFSDKPASWPSSWPTLDEAVSLNGSYVMNDAARATFLNNPNFDAAATGTALIGANGFPGVADGTVRAPREAYFVITDNDPAEGGIPEAMNVRVDVWALQWDDFVNRNFIVYKLLFTNIGNKTIEDVYVGIHDDPDAPEQGTNEWTDDYAYLIPPGKDEDGDGAPDADADPRSDVDNDGLYTGEDSLQWNTLFLWDGDDNSAGFVPNKVGWVGLKFLETPTDEETGQPKGVTALDIFQYSQAPATDADAYDQMAGIKHMSLSADNPQQGGGTPIMEPTNPNGAPGDIFGIQNSYGPDVTIVASSGPYTLEPGQSLPFTFVSVHGTSQRDIINNAKLAQILFNNDYLAAAPPPTPVVQAVPGDQQVTLYWDDRAEHGTDPLTGNNAFEGYRIYRSDDGGQTFGEAIVDLYGTTQGYIPMEIFDLQNQVAGESTERRYFDLGSDSGLRHQFVDRNVENGKTYLYAVVAYDREDSVDGVPVPPLETPINLANPNAPGDNTVLATPQARPAGRVYGSVETNATQTAGSSDVSSQTVEVIDQTALVPGTYTIQTVALEDGSKGYTVTLGGEVVSGLGGTPIEDVPFYDEGTDLAPIFNGVRVIVEDVAFGIKDAVHEGGTLTVDPISYIDGTTEQLTSSYEIRFVDEEQTYFDFDQPYGPITAPFEVWEVTSDGSEVQLSAEVFDQRFDGNGNGQWDLGEAIVILGENADPNTLEGYLYYFYIEGDAYSTGDVIHITTNQPIVAGEDAYQFAVTGPEIDETQLEEDMELITVVPNPFVVSSSYETGRFGVQRELQFHQLPERCTIKIFTTAGELVQIIEHDGGSIEPWNLQTYNGQEVSFGVYLYIVQTPDGEEQTGKFAVIK